MASSSLAADSDEPNEAAARHLDRLLADFTPVPGVHEPYSATSHHCKTCSAHFGMSIVFPCLSYRYDQRRSGGRHGEAGR